MNVSPYLTILLILGSQRTAQVWDGRHSSHRNFLPFQCMPPAAACSFIFANASRGRGLGWRLKPTSTEVVLHPALPDRPTTTWTNHVVAKEVQYPPKQKAQQNHKISSNFHGKMKLEETLCLRVFNLNQFISKPIAFRIFEVSGAKRRGHASSGT